MHRNSISFVCFSICIIVTIGAMSFTNNDIITINELRKIYSSGNPTTWPEANIDSLARKHVKEITVLDSVAYPSNNPYSAAKEQLGKILFFDPRLSASNQIACASCHDPQLGWGDGKRVAFGHNRQTGNRNAMTLFNTALYRSWFWDGRSFSLEHQAMFPTMDAVEMSQPLATLPKKLNKIKGYKKLFKEAFNQDNITTDLIFKAIATFERSITSKPTRFDAFIKGKADALTDDEVMGLHLFRTKARCINCHNGGLFSDNEFHNDGQTLFGSDNEDLGLYNRTKKIEDVGKFKTPSLREVANTGPWMHHGNFPTLKDVVQFYNLGNPAPISKKNKLQRDSLLPKTSPILQKLYLTDVEINQLIAFLQSITNTPQRVSLPVRPQ